MQSVALSQSASTMLSGEPKSREAHFDIHFADIDGLRAAVAHELAEALEQVRHPQRIRESDPLERIASGCFAFIQQALLSPVWGNLIARAASALPTVGRVARENLAEDLRQAVLQKRITAASPELSAAIVTGIVFQTMRSASDKRLPEADVPVAVVAILLALGAWRSLPEPANPPGGTKKMMPAGFPGAGPLQICYNRS